MSMKSLPYPQKHNCPRQNCLGHAKDYNNYLHLTKTKPKAAKTARSFHSLHEKPKEKHKNAPKSKPSRKEGERTEEKKKSEELQEMLQQKSRKISEMKQRIKDYEGRARDFERREKQFDRHQREFQARIRQYQVKVAQLQAIINQNEHPKSPISLQKPSQSMMSHYQQQLRLLQTSQKATLQAVQKCRIIQREFHQYRNESERKMERLLRQNEQLRHFQSDDKYDEDISSLRKELHKLSQTQHSPSHLDMQEETVSALKSQLRQMVAQRQILQAALRQKEESLQVLRRNLEAINRKVDRWNEEYKAMTQQRRSIQLKYSDLAQRHQQRKERQAREKQEWASIFRELMQEVEKLKREIVRLQRSNHKLLKVRTEQNNAE